MKLKKEYVFIIINYTIFFLCWIIFDSGITLKDNGILCTIGLLTLLVHGLLLLGGEGIIYWRFASENNSRIVVKVLLISLLVNISINILSSSVNYIIVYISLNQIIGVIIGRMCYKRKYR